MTDLSKAQARRVPKQMVVNAVAQQAQAIGQIDAALTAWSQHELAILRRGFWGRVKWLVSGR